MTNPGNAFLLLIQYIRKPNTENDLLAQKVFMFDGQSVDDIMEQRPAC